MVTRPLRAPTVPEATRAPSQPPRVASLDYAGAARLAEVRDMLDAESLDLARHKLAELLHLYPMVPSIYVMRAMLLDAEGDPASAEQELTRALYLDPLHLEAQLRLGLVLLRLGRVERGKHVLRRAVCMPDSGRTDVEDMRLDAAQRLVALIEQETAARAQAR